MDRGLQGLIQTVAEGGRGHEGGARSGSQNYPEVDYNLANYTHIWLRYKILLKDNDCLLFYVVFQFKFITVSMYHLSSHHKRGNYINIILSLLLLILRPLLSVHATQNPKVIRSK